MGLFVVKVALVQLYVQVLQSCAVRYRSIIAVSSGIVDSFVFAVQTASPPQPENLHSLICYVYVTHITDKVKKLPQEHGVLQAVSVNILMSGSECGGIA
jgi:hypothetical protein